MASTARQNKTARKGAPEPTRRPNAWTTGARASPTYTPPPNASRPSVPTTPSNTDRVLQSLAGLTGTTITLLTKTGIRYEGVVSSTSGEGDTTGVTLKDVKEVSKPGAALKDTVFIASTNIDTWSSGPADVKPPNGVTDSFRTDIDISQQKSLTSRQRELLAWQPPTGDVPSQALGAHNGMGDEETFGLGSNGNASWDQFQANEQLFGITTQFDENVYTTKLDRTAANFREREKQAQKIANEIIGAVSSNSHVAEERNQVVDDSGANEEDKYSTVVRGANAYIPPGARKAGVTSPPVTNPAKTEIPKVSVNGPDGSSIPAQSQSPPSNSSKAPSPAPSSTTASSNKPPADPLPAFRDFVTNEKQRLTQKRQALVKNEMDKRMADLIKFSQSFKLNKPIPDDLVPILAKDEEKQKAIRDKASKDASSAGARSIAATSTGPTPGARAPIQATAAKALDATRKPIPSASAKTVTVNPPPSATAVPKPAPVTAKVNGSESKPTKPISMFIQPIPPFKGTKSRQSSTASTQANGTSQAAASSSGAASHSGSSAVPVSPTTANRLNVNATSFRPNPKANAFTPVTGTTSPANGSSNQSVASTSVSPKAKTESVPSTPNPFFGTRPIKKNTPVNIKDDFNPFKHSKVADASNIPATWPYSGKRYMQMFPPPQHPPQQHSPHMAPPPPPLPPPSYEEDSAAQAAARGYVYAYPPYGYPGQVGYLPPVDGSKSPYLMPFDQPMMPGMAPPGPPGAYMPGPFMQPMPYPPGMPPPNAMYASPSMAQMPPPQAYMPPPPPPGTYPPPPTGAAPRPSMPPTPIPAHAHPYYHQSPQLQHAVPYPMMMPPPAPNMPPHQYDNGPAPPVQMGGHA